MHLREITGELAYVSSLTIPEIPGFKNACIFYPYLSDSARRPYAAGYDNDPGMLAITVPFDDVPMHGYGNCWWGITRSALVAMLRAARFEVVSERRQNAAPFLTEFIVRPLPIDPSLPPLFYFRERGEARDRGEERWAFETWYEDQRHESELH
jgi:hypothetical protein